jgi:hypothetical protein
MVEMTGMGVWGKWQMTRVVAGAQEELVVVDKEERGVVVVVGRQGKGEFGVAVLGAKPVAAGLWVAGSP